MRVRVWRAACTQGEGEGLIYFVVSEAFGFVGEGLLFGGDGEGCEGLDGLPWSLVDEAIGPGGVALRVQEGHVRHGTARPPGRREAEEEEGGGDGDGEAAEILHSFNPTCLVSSLQSPIQAWSDVIRDEHKSCRGEGDRTECFPDDLLEWRRFA